MPDDDFSDPFERWHRAWFVAPLELDFGAGLPAFRLQPVCLGHFIYLQALASPLLRLGIEDVGIGLPDFFTALRILRDTRWPFTAPLDLIPDEADEQLLAAHTAASQAGTASPIERALNEQFLPWWFACQIGPELMEREGTGGRTLTAPLALTMAIRLLRTGGFGEKRVYTMPLALLRFNVAAIAEQEGGGTSFLTPEMVEAMREAATQPDLDALDDAALFEFVKADRGEQFAESFMERRRTERANAACIAAALAPKAEVSRG